MRWGLLIMLVGCGRLQFETHGNASDGGGGSADARGFDAAGDGVAATTCGMTVNRACDGFESGQINWTLDTFRGTIALDTTRAYRGTSSVHAHINQITTSTTNPRATLLGPGGLGTAVTGIIYFRVWMYIASPMPANPFNQMINAANQSGQGISLGTKNGAIATNDYTDISYAESATAFPLDRWACFQFEMPSNVTGTTRAFLDGVELTDAALAKTTPQPSPDHVYLGVEWVGSPTSLPAVDAWMDEIVIDTNPTTCAQ